MTTMLTRKNTLDHLHLHLLKSIKLNLPKYLINMPVQRERKKMSCLVINWDFFFKEAGVDPEKEGAVTLGVAWKLKAKTLGEFSRTEFIDGWTALGCDEVAKMKGEIASIKSSLQSKTSFRDFYRWLFDYIKEDSDRKSIDIEPAIEMMGLVLPPHFSLADTWIEFLKTRKEKTISKDIWEQTFEFAKDIKSDLTNYEDEESGGAWPVLFDEFVIFARKAKGLKKPTKDDKKEEKKS